IASRCGVFAKSDIQPLLNQGARREDLAAGILYAVANQTVSGLAQGRRIEGNILYLGGPLSFIPQLREAFDKTLGIRGTCPEDSLYYVALGAAFAGIGRQLSLSDLLSLFSNGGERKDYKSCPALFRSQDEYEAFKAEHEAHSSGIREVDSPSGRMYLGVDAGSTTTKILLMDDNCNIFRPLYAPNRGNPVQLVKDYLKDLYSEYPNIRIAGSCVTGYGEQLIRAAFNLDNGIVETMAHFYGARQFLPAVDFILDIGGQDIKCFQIRNGSIENLYLNEACSSGCGSFLQTFASALGYTSEEFARLGLFADAPVDLGSRCTVFMNSSVKQAQKDGATIQNIAAGLSISVVKNALYKVIRCSNARQLGRNIVVQGGTFLNNCVLRAFEMELGTTVVRPKFAPLMGAYGSALYAREHARERSTTITSSELDDFKHTVRPVTCKGCMNHCNLTVNTFSGNRRYIAGNRCSKPLGSTGKGEGHNLYEYKISLLGKYMNQEKDDGRRNIGLPMGLNLFELLPFWHTLFTRLGFNVVTSPLSSRRTYLNGQSTIPSDTVCYPAKLMHGHLDWLLKKDVGTIFYPDMTYNLDEHLGVDHYNCPVVAYYPELLRDNVRELGKVKYINDFMSLADQRQFTSRITQVLLKHFPDLRKTDIKVAVDAAYREYHSYLADVRSKANEYLEFARTNKKHIIVLAGRPYHLDPEVNHGIDKLISEQGAVVVSEDSVSQNEGFFPTKVRNQWTYHSRLYAAAKFVAEAPKDLSINLVQLISFGCGVDAITSDETRSIVEAGGKIYTQLKIDEMSNMGSVTIRLRSLFAVLDGGRR
ncbi:MAG: 2-hydroxyacyl-CoA dehydratase, partial [Spirochaetales bacterium]|nr:2-hydroxyacyl-CoA dehydratase [Spirochaetales bacterium]